MADTKLTNLPTLSSIERADLLYVVSKQNTIAGESRSMRFDDLFSTISFLLSSTDQIISPAITCTGLMESVTLNADIINATYVNATTGVFTNLISNFIPLTANTDITVDNTNDKSRIYHLDTSTGNLSVILPSTLSNGFNVRITNTGTNTVYISSTQTPMICAFSNRCTLQFGSLFIYKTNNKFFGTGDFFR
jgi:hypothetical protein